MIKKFTIICMTVALLLTGSLYKPQKTEAFAITLTGIAITALIMAGVGMLGYLATSETDLNPFYDDLDSGTKALIGEITVDHNQNGDSLKLQHSQIGAIAGLVIQNVYNKFAKAFRYNNYDNPVSHIKDTIGNTYIAAGIVPAFTSTSYTTSKFTYYGIIGTSIKFPFFQKSNTSQYMEVPKDTSLGLSTVNIGKAIMKHAMTLAYMPASLFGYEYDDNIAVSIITTEGTPMPTGLINSIYLADDTIAIPWGSVGNPMLEISVKPLVNGTLSDHSYVDVQTITIAGTLPSIGEWEPGLELDPPTAQDLANDRMNGLGDDLVFTGAGTVILGEWGTITRDIVNPELELDPTMPWDTWDDIAFPVIDAGVIAGDASIPSTDGIAVANPFEGWLVGGLAGLGNLLKNIGAWLLGGLISALNAIFNLLKLGFESILAFFTSIAGTLASIYAFLMSIFFPAATWFSDILAGIQAIPSFFSGINALLSFIVRMFGFLLNMLVALIDLIAFQLFNGIINSIGTVLTSIKNIFSILPDPLDEISYRIINIASFTALLTLVLKILRIRKA